MSDGRQIPGLILAAGGLVRDEGKILIIYNRKRAEWTLPRGKLKNDESPERAALREVREETGYPTHLSRYLGAISYMVNDLPKVVLYWEMLVGGPQGKIDQTEVGEVRWLAPAEALKLLTHPLERDLVLRNA